MKRNVVLAVLLCLVFFPFVAFSAPTPAPKKKPSVKKSAKTTAKKAPAKKAPVKKASAKKPAPKKTAKTAKKPVKKPVKAAAKPEPKPKPAPPAPVEAPITTTAVPADSAAAGDDAETTTAAEDAELENDEPVEPTGDVQTPAAQGENMLEKEAPAGDVPVAAADGAAAPEEKKEEWQPGATRHQIGGSLYYSMASTLMSGATVLGTKTDVEDTSESALGVGARYRMMMSSGLGAIASFNYELPRKLKQRKAGSVTSNYSNSESLSLMALELSAAYSFGAFFGFGGINYSMPTLNNVSNASASGALGIQLGAGYDINDMISVDLAYRTINL
ncbi:MAG: outer membrane beta-barrel protein, partial [Bdellovibrionia bacterium]